jgi:hypothetical protein
LSQQNFFDGNKLFTVRLIKLALISVIILFGIITAISLIIPSHIRLAKVISIRPEKDSIFSLIKNKDQWYRWHPSFLNGQQLEMLSNIRVSILSENDSVLAMRWEQPGKKPLNMGWQLFDSTGINSATLQWHMDFELAWYPWEKLGSLFYEANYGAMMEQGLVNIKKEIEK